VALNFLSLIKKTEKIQRGSKNNVLGNTANVNFGWFAYDATDGHPKKHHPTLNHA